MNKDEHRKLAEKLKVNFAIIVVSTSRYQMLKQGIEPQDESGDTAQKIIEQNGYSIVMRTIVPDSERQILEKIEEAITKKADAILLIGGTGITPDDITIETIKPILEKEIPGFGELLRWESYKEIGTAAMMSRATAGIYKNSIIFAIPGSTGAVKTALRLIIPEIKHMVYLARRKPTKSEN